MNDAIYAVIAVMSIVVSAGLLYLYLSFEMYGTKNVKEAFSLNCGRKHFLILPLMLVSAVFAYFYSYFSTNNVFIKSFMNAEVMLWLLCLGYIDIKEKIIPNKLIVTGISFWTLLSLLEIFVTHTAWKQVLLFSLSGALVCGGILFVIAIAVKSALGMGDVKMFFVIGLLYGLTNTYSILLSSILAMAVVSIVLLIAKKVTKKTAIPMAPFVAFGFLLNVLMGI